MKENILSNVFETYWTQFETEFNKIIKNTAEEDIVEECPKDDLLNEILYSVRGIDKRLRRVEDIEYYVNASSINNISNNSTLQYRLTPIEELNLSVRAFNILKAMRISTIGDLMKLDLDRIKELSMKNKEEITSMIEKIKRDLK